MINALVLEPDPWRFRGLCSVLKDSGKVEIIGEADYAKVLALTTPRRRVMPEVVLIAHRLILEYGVSQVPYLRDLFPDCAVLVHGEIENLNVTAQLLAVGARGYFVLSAPPGYLATAVKVVSSGQVWGPREAVTLFADLAAAGKVPALASQKRQEKLSREEMELLQLLNEGLKNREIAQRLQLAEATVKARLTRLYKQFGVRTRLQLHSRAISQGLIRKVVAPPVDRRELADLEQPVRAERGG